jgi:hypothetical protein
MMNAIKTKIAPVEMPVNPYGRLAAPLVFALFVAGALVSFVQLRVQTRRCVA